MSSLICITTPNGFCGKKSVYINPDKIIMLDSSHNFSLRENGRANTHIQLVDGARLRIFETPDEIIALISKTAAPSKNNATESLPNQNETQAAPASILH